MQILVQYTLATPANWVTINLGSGKAASAWSGSAKKSKPAIGALPTLNNITGWIMALNVQGVVFEGFDCYACKLDATGTGVVVTGWTEDYPGSNHGVEVTFLPAAPDAKFGGALNTRQTRRAWADPSVADMVPNALPYSQFVRPAETTVRYGCYVSEPLLAAHKAVRSERGWRDWA